MAAGCAITQDASGRNQQLIDARLEGKFDDTDVLDLEKATKDTLLTSEDSTLSIPPDNYFLSEDLQLFLRLTALTEEDFRVFPSEQEVMAKGGELYTWKYDDLKHCPVLRRTVSDTVMILEAGSTSCNRKKSSKPNVKKKCGQVSNLTVASAPAQSYSSAIGRGQKVFEQAQEMVAGGQNDCSSIGRRKEMFKKAQEMIAGGQNDCSSLESSGYWSIISPKSIAPEIQKEQNISNNEPCSLNCGGKLIKKKVSNLNLCPSRFPDADIDKVSLSNERRDQTIKNITKFQDGFHTMPGQDNLRKHIRDSRISGEEDQPLTNQLIQPYCNAQEIVNQEKPEQYVFLPLKSASSMPTLKSSSTLSYLTYSPSNFSAVTSNFQSPSTYSWRGSRLYNTRSQSHAATVHGDNSIEFYPLEESKSQICLSDDHLVKLHDVDTYNNIPGKSYDTSQLNQFLPHNEKPVITIGSPEQLTSLRRAQASPPSDDSDDSVSVTLSPGLRMFLQTKPSSADNFKSDDTHKCLHCSSSSQTTLSGLVSPHLKGFLSNSLRNSKTCTNSIVSNSIQQPVACVPQQRTIPCSRECHNTLTLQVGKVSSEEKSSSDMLSSEVKYSPWSHIVAKDSPQPSENLPMDKPKEENKAIKMDSLVVNSRANIAGIRYKGRLKIPGVPMNDGLPFQKVAARGERNPQEVAGTSVLTPQLPIAGFNHGSDETDSSTTTDSRPQLVPYENSSLVPYENNSWTCSGSEIGKSIARERMVQDSVNLNLRDIVLVVDESTEDEIETADGLEAKVDFSMTWDRGTDSPPPSQTAAPVASTSSQEQTGSTYCFNLKLRGEVCSHQLRKAFQSIFRCCKRSRT